MFLVFGLKIEPATARSAKSLDASGLNAGVYNFKFFMWETGYWRTMDIAHDRAGYYLCWGCLNWVPGVYTSQSLFLTNHPNTLSTGFAVSTILVGALMIYINWEADVQRQTFRDSAGQCRIWGKKPHFLIAKYKTGMHLTSLACHPQNGFSVV